VSNVLDFSSAKRCFRCGRGKTAERGFIVTVIREVDNQTRQVHGDSFEPGDTDRMQAALGLIAKPTGGAP
jgi:hypothetical protein